jgi:hypothetical protein
MCGSNASNAYGNAGKVNAITIDLDLRIELF